MRANTETDRQTNILIAIVVLVHCVVSVAETVSEL